jgi:hypothetical protein
MMDEGRAKSILLTTFVLALAILAWTEIYRLHTVPRPVRFVGAGLVWGILGLSAPLISYRVASTMSVAMVIALLYSYYDVRISKGIIDTFGSNVVTTSFDMSKEVST